MSQKEVQNSESSNNKVTVNEVVVETNVVQGESQVAVPVAIAPQDSVHEKNEIERIKVEQA